MAFYTDCAFVFLGDKPDKPASKREVQMLGYYKSNEKVTVIVNNVITHVGREHIFISEC